MFFFVHFCSLMSAVAEHTRIGPPERVKRLISFNQRLFSEPKCMETFAQWNMTLDTNLVEVPGRVLPIETIKFDNSVTYVRMPQIQPIL